MNAPDVNDIQVDKILDEFGLDSPETSGEDPFRKSKLFLAEERQKMVSYEANAPSNS